MSWRERFAPVIAAVIRESVGLPTKVVQARLKRAYPTGHFQSGSAHVRSVWNDECRRQLGLKKSRKQAGGQQLGLLAEPQHNDD